MQIQKNLYTDLSIERITISRSDVRDLPMKVFLPQSWTPNDRRPGIIFWFGGGFCKNDMDHFRMQSEYFAHKGLVVFTPDYRLTVEDGVKISDCLYDGRCALKYIMENAAHFGVNQEKLVVSGGSAGGMIAASTVILSELWQTPPCCAPYAMVLFNPMLELALEKDAFGCGMVGESGEEIRADAVQLIRSCSDDMIQHPEKYSCCTHLRAGLPPALILQGTDDPLCSTVHRFAEQYRRSGNYIEVEEYPGCTHGFFNPGRSPHNFYYEQTKYRMEMFLIEQGLLNPKEEKE